MTVNIEGEKKAGPYNVSILLNPDGGINLVINLSFILSLTAKTKTMTVQSIE